jgi:hypothetical protein
VIDLGEIIRPYLREVQPLGYLRLVNVISHSQPRILPRVKVSRDIDIEIDPEVTQITGMQAFDVETSGMLERSAKNKTWECKCSHNDKVSTGHFPM